MHSCIKCAKFLTKVEIRNAKCSNCGKEFEIADDQTASLFMQDEVIQQFAETVYNYKREEKLDYTGKMKDMIKAYLSNIVISGIKVFSFYLVRDNEVVCFLFRLRNVKRFIFLEFNLALKYEGVESYTKKNGKYSGGMKSYIKTKDFEHAIDICVAVYTRKSKSYPHVGTKDMSYIRDEYGDVKKWN